MRWVQCVGRILRIADGKERAILLDHSGTIEELGFPEDIIINHLDTGDNTQAIAERVAKDKKEKKPTKCANSECNYVKPAGEHECSKCGFAPRRTRDVEVIAGELKQIKGKPKKEDKQEFWNELIGWRQDMNFKGKSYSDGYLSHIYKRKFGVWPRGLSGGSSCEPTESTLGFIKSGQIAYAKSKRK
jgi:hypothetical protein